MDTSELAKKAHYWESQLTDEAMGWLEDRGLARGTIRKAGLGFVPEGRYSGSISIPFWNPDGTAKGIRFRYLRPSTHKYDSLKGVKIHLYNVMATDADRVWICEGEFDSLILSQLGYQSVGVPGVNGFKPSWKYLFSSCDQVTIVMDGDDAGKQGANRLASILGEVVPVVKLARMPIGKDVTDLFLTDVDELRRVVE